ncbi:MAG: radical SAM protein [Oscillospiraceae bacterium]|jgi:hypothetical protein|nr:radical SAM protein [Oscillospiraceae bacterium]
MNVLLIEPPYRNNFPPLGLMKIAAYHRDFRNDFVYFSKGKLTAAAPQIAWDRVYVTTLFTYEWRRTVETIEYAKTLVPAGQVFVGGILASLMPEELAVETGITPMTGLLTDSAILGFGDRVNIDRLTPDYSILNHISYKYPAENTYFVSATKGCGMRCGFCAVQTLEPEYTPYISIAEQVREAESRYGARQNLILMDNNVLLSPHFERIIEDIIALGFGRGAMRINPQTGKPNRRYVDFNQGLDANLLTPQKAELLAKIALKTARIAFDHIDDADKYLTAIRIAESAGLDRLSNYILFNTTEFSGKGTPRRADTPHDLWERLRLNVEFAESANARRKQLGLPRFEAYSYPMRYAPLNATNRDFVGNNWTAQELKNVNLMRQLSKGVVYSRRPFFETAWGATAEEFEARLQLPRECIEHGLRAKLSQLSVKALV